MFGGVGLVAPDVVSSGACLLPVAPFFNHTLEMFGLHTRSYVEQACLIHAQVHSCFRVADLHMQSHGSAKGIVRVMAIAMAFQQHASEAGKNAWHWRLGRPRSPSIQEFPAGLSPVVEKLDAVTKVIPCNWYPTWIWHVVTMILLPSSLRQTLSRQ